METKYGSLPDEMLVVYVNGMISRVWKILPMKEQNIHSLPSYIESTLREFVGQRELVFELKEKEEFLSILGTMETLINQNDFVKFRSDIFKIISLIEKLKISLGGDSK